MQIWTPNTPLQNGQYIIKKVIGGGGFGETYLADDTEENRQVVIKTLNREQRQKPDFAERQKKFRKEAIDLSKCYHPHIVQVYDNFAEDGLWAIVMEYIDGSNLELYTENYTEEHGYLPETEALRYIDQIGLALECVHERGLLHRDVKPSNIMLRRQSKEAVLIDFGLAREFQPGKIRSMTAKQTQGYAPIEQYEERKNNPGYEHLKPGYYTDVYALAATLYFILTTRPPLPSLALVESGYPLVNPQEKYNPKISDKVNAAILKGMEMLPQNRPQTVREFRELLGLVVKPVMNIPTPTPVNYNTIPVQQKPPQNIPTPQAINPEVQLKSSCGMDYSKLQNYLKAGKWKEADEETARVMLAVAKRERQGYLDVNNIDNFPCEDLRTIDQLWVKYSDGRFGFSVQKRIFQGLDGTREFGSDIWNKFGDKVGWRKGGGCLYHIDTFDKKAPEGHLPVIGYRFFSLHDVNVGRFLRGGLHVFSPLASRLVNCNI